MHVTDPNTEQYFFVENMHFLITKQTMSMFEVT